MRGLLLLVPLLCIACTSDLKSPNLGDLYSRTAQYHQADRNPVIVIPGILGSRIVAKDNTVVWGAFGGDYARPNSDIGAQQIGIPMALGKTLAELVDDNKVDGALDRVKLSLFGLPVSLNAYANILATLGAGGYLDQQLGMSGAVDYGTDHFTCFQFAYDWRRDNVENARLLHEFIVEKEKFVREKLEERTGEKVNRRIRFDIVAHSMGGLLTRYYLRYGGAEPVAGAKPTWAGAQYIERAIFVATPNAGSASAITDLAHGRKFVPFLPQYDAALLGTMPAIYQLLPRERHGTLVRTNKGAVRLDPLDPAVWEEQQWGLADPEQDDVLQRLLPGKTREQRREIALDHQRKCLDRARAFQAALDLPASPPPGTELYLFAGDAVQTPAIIRADTAQTWSSMMGDGTVTRSSALLDERIGNEWKPMLVSPIHWRQVTFLFKEHLALTKDPHFSDNILYLLLEAPRDR